MYSYYAVYPNDRTDPPAGIFVMEDAPGHGLMWDHREHAWVYNPALIVRFLDDYRNEDRFMSVDRLTAEQITPSITGGEELPDEETIAWVFRWRGRPPQGD